MQIPLYQPIGGNTGNSNVDPHPVYFTPLAQQSWNLALQCNVVGSASVYILPIHILPQVRAGFGFNPIQLALGYQSQAGLDPVSKTLVTFTLGPIVTTGAAIVYLTLDSANRNIIWTGSIWGTEYVGEPMTHVAVPGAY